MLISLERKQICQKEQCHSAVFFKSLQISSNYFSFKRHFKSWDWCQIVRGFINGQAPCKLNDCEDDFASPGWTIKKKLFLILIEAHFKQFCPIMKTTGFLLRMLWKTWIICRIPWNCKLNCNQHTWSIWTATEQPTTFLVVIKRNVWKQDTDNH